MTKACTAERAYRAYRPASPSRDGHAGSVALRHPKRGGMLTYAEARALARRHEGCATVGFFPFGATHITTVWSKPSCPAKVRHKARRGG